MERLVERPSATTAAPVPSRFWPLVVAGLVVFPPCLVLGRSGLWLPALGTGVALLSWTSWWLLPLLAVEAVVVGWLLEPASLAVGDALLLSGQIGLSWWAYHTLGRGSRWLEDPRSCMLFLVLVPGLIAAGFALVQALLWRTAGVDTPLWIAFGMRWVSQILGLLVPMPLLLVLVTPWLARYRLVGITAPLALHGNPWQRWSTGELVEVAGLTLSATVLALVLTGLQVQSVHPGLPPWSLWGVGLLIVVWAALRQGLRGGTAVANSAALAAILVFEATSATDAGLLQGYLLAECSTALLVGVAAGWIQASEARYRHVFSQVPLVLYSARLPRPYRPPLAAPRSRRDGRLDAPGPVISREALVTLVSQASRQVFERAPEEMTGPYARWLERIVPDDRELVVAALAQLSLQRQPVTCEYRVIIAGSMTTASERGNPNLRWVRDSLTPHYTEDGLLDGWEGFVEDITERRKLSYNLRRSSQMLQALIANLPAGVLFVQGPQGYAILANARARQLLGQREDASVPLAQLCRQYRLHRPDGSEYPVDELPVAKALKLGMTCSANDLVVHRPDGRRIRLVSWAAPVQLDEPGPVEAAVWVLEDVAAFPPPGALNRSAEQAAG